MRSSSEGIVATQAGSLPRPDELIALNAAGDEKAAPAAEGGEKAAPAAEGGEKTAQYRAKLDDELKSLVARQRDIGIGLVGDGEFGKATSQRVNYGAWWSYSFQRLGGLELGKASLFDIDTNRVGAAGIRLNSFGDRRDRQRFAAAYSDPDSGTGIGRSADLFPVCTGPLRYIGQDAINADIAGFKRALDAAGVDDGFMTSVGPGSCSRIGNEYYRDDEEWLYACADAMREEYKAILDAGLILQIDDPGIAENWDQINPEPPVADYRAFTMKRVEALNYALRDLPKERIRFHLCWGSWHGPHTTDLPMAELIEVLLAIDVRAYSFEAGNVRHEHEWKVWRDVTLPEGKLILPGVVSHATNVVEHPELVADRIVRFAECVGRENVLASTDCGLGGRVHPQIAWAKLESLAAGAELATQRLWP